MKVESIEVYQKNGEDRYKIFFEGEPDTPLIQKREPDFQRGDDIPRERLQLGQSGNNFYYYWKPRPKEERPMDKDISIRAQVAVKILSDLICADKLDTFLNPSNYAEEALQTWVNRSLVLDGIRQVEGYVDKQ